MKKSKILLGLFSLLLFLMPLHVKAENTAEPYVDVSTISITLSPQIPTATMNTAGRNLPEGTKLGILVQNPEMVAVAWENPEQCEKLNFAKGAVAGETIVTVYAESNPAICRQITVKNMDTEPVIHYEGVGSMDFYGLNLMPVPYLVKATSEDPNGVFGVICQDLACNTTLLFNQVGAYSGSATLPHGENAFLFHVYAGGKWTLDLTPLTTATGSSNLYGIGDAISERFVGDGESHNVYLANVAANGNYIVWLYDVSQSPVKKTLLMNGVGTCSKYKKVTLQKDHIYYVSVKSRGNWAVNFQKGDPLTLVQ